MIGPCYLPASHEDVPHVAVAMGFENGDQHAAILFRGSDRKICVIDFTIDGTIQSTCVAHHAAEYAWSIPQLPPMILQQVAGFCESIATKSQRFTYTFSFNENTRLTKVDGNLVIEGGTDGFTCATFVLAVFRSVGFPLADLQSWTLLAKDETWQRRMVQYLYRHKVELSLTDETLEDRASEIPCLRYTPSDVIGVCRAGQHPTSCENARSAGAEVVEWLQVIDQVIR